MGDVSGRASKFVNCMGTDFRYGRIVFPARDQYLYRALAECGDYSYGETVVLRRLISEGDIILDVGGNVGAMALFFSDCVGDAGKVLTFEASPFAFGLLQHNAELNGRSNIVCRRAIVSSESGTGQFIDPDAERIATADFGSLSVSVDARRVPGRFVETEKLRIDDLGLDRCNFIKVDVEGHEASVVGGALETIERYHPFLSVETGNEEDDLSWLEMLRGLGYRVFCISTKVFCWPNFKKRDISDFPGDVSVNAFCVPPGRDQMAIFGEIPRQEVRVLEDLVAYCRRFRKRVRY